MDVDLEMQSMSVQKQPDLQRDPVRKKENNYHIKAGGCLRHPEIARHRDGIVRGGCRNTRLQCHHQTRQQQSQHKQTRKEELAL